MWRSELDGVVSLCRLGGVVILLAPGAARAGAPEYCSSSLYRNVAACRGSCPEYCTSSLYSKELSCAGCQPAYCSSSLYSEEPACSGGAVIVVQQPTASVSAASSSATVPPPAPTAPWPGLAPLCAPFGIEAGATFPEAVGRVYDLFPVVDMSCRDGTDGPDVLLTIEGGGSIYLESNRPYGRVDFLGAEGPSSLFRGPGAALLGYDAPTARASIGRGAVVTQVEGRPAAQWSDDGERRVAACGDWRVSSVTVRQDVLLNVQWDPMPDARPDGASCVSIRQERFGALAPAGFGGLAWGAPPPKGATRIEVPPMGLGAPRSGVVGYFVSGSPGAFNFCHGRFYEYRDVEYVDPEGRAPYRRADLVALYGRPNVPRGRPGEDSWYFGTVELVAREPSFGSTGEDGPVLVTMTDYSLGAPCGVDQR